jgi:hypothetical protein
MNTGWNRFEKDLRKYQFGKLSLRIPEVTIRG